MQHAPILSSPHPAETRDHSVFLCLDAMRGVAAALIMIRHIPNMLASAPFPQSYLAVDLFFVLSGVVIANAYEKKLLQDMSFWTFLKIRLIRLYPLYLLGIILTLLVAVLRPEYGVQKLVYHVTLSLFFLPNPDDLQGLFPLNGPVWSLFFEMVVNVFYALTLRYFISEKRLWMIIASCGIGLLICILIQGSADVGWKLKSLPAGFVRVGFSFYAGVLISRWHRSRGDRVVGGWFSEYGSYLLIACITLLLVVDPPKGAVGVSDALTILLLFPICVMFAMQQYPSGMTAKIFKLGGLASYAIYVLHVPTARLFGDSFEILFKMELKPGLLAASIFSILFIGFCLLLDRFFDIPLRQRLRRYA
jgi:peptidoglycan/LPS O-acetylase OafA/YrhL